MNKTDAAKLAQAYQWLADGKEVECQLHDRGPWLPWNGDSTDWLNFRVKPEPEPLMELWANRYGANTYSYHATKEVAMKSAQDYAARVAVHLREVREPDIQAMVSRFLAWKLPDDFLPDGGIRFAPVKLPNGEVAFWPTGTNLLHAGQAEQMIRHILGEEK